jgi:hypothetical protein
MDWRSVGEGLIRRGELLLSLDFIEGYGLELNILNDVGLGDHLILKAILCSSLLYVTYSPCPTGSLKASLSFK